MSRYLYATKIEVVPTNFTYEREGEFPASYTVPAYTTIATAEDGFYLYSPPFDHDIETLFDPERWPQPRNKKIQLFRDYWSFGYEHGPANENTRSPKDLAHILSPKKTVVSTD